MSGDLGVAGTESLRGSSRGDVRKVAEINKLVLKLKYTGKSLTDY